MKKSFDPFGGIGKFLLRPGEETKTKTEHPLKKNLTSVRFFFLVSAWETFFETEKPTQT